VDITITNPNLEKLMKTTKFHVSNLGKFRAGVVADDCGYVRCHDSPRYDTATDDQLADWRENGRSLAVRNAAGAEMCNRQIAEYQAKN